VGARHGRAEGPARRAPAADHVRPRGGGRRSGIGWWPSRAGCCGPNSGRRAAIAPSAA
jgi:hypothetical protein